MKTTSRLVISLAVALAVTAVFSWPLLRYATEGIPSSAANIETGNKRAMISGDHLQFLYHMWLGKDTFTGKTPWFYNLYEFNTGDDEARREVRPYYLPFSLFFMAGSVTGNQALGWNVAIAITMWLTYLFAWLLARAYCRDELSSALLALFALLIPFPWIVLMGGSPTGFSMMWVPLLLYGIDRWINRRSVIGAAIMGGVIFFSEWSDTHVFFFSVLLTPAWVIVTYLYRVDCRWPTRDEIMVWLRAAWPLVLFVALAGLKAWSLRQGLQDTAIASGRSLHEIDLFSHGWRSLVHLEPQGDSGKIYVGYYALILLGLIACWHLAGLIRSPREARRWAPVLAMAGIAAVLFLAMGTKNPLGPRLWSLWTSLIPPYGMIRQPDKIFCVLPALLVAVGAMSLGHLTTAPSRWLARVGLLVVVAPLAWDYQARLNPTICLLDEEQQSYAAVAEDAQRADETPRALALPLWPGDSHWSSVYQYYASLYRIRMVNGYRPTARKAYLEAIYEPYSPMNSGYPSDEQLDGLLAMGVRHILLHEDAFPEKVSSFPAGATLANLLDHPRLRLRARDESVWCFSILEAEDHEKDPRAFTDKINVLFPVRIWEWASSAWPDEAKITADDAIGGRYARVEGPMSTFMESRYIRTAGAYPLAWHLRVRGRGTFELLPEVNGLDGEPVVGAVDSADWIWVRVPAPLMANTAEQTAKIRVVEGVMDLDELLLIHAGWSGPLPGETRVLPAASFFRAGYLLDDLSGVVLRARRDSNETIFYGRNLYLEPGVYELRLNFESVAPHGTHLGTMVMSSGTRGDVAQRFEVFAGKEARLIYEQPDNQFFFFGLDFSRAADLVIRDIALTRLR